MRRIRTISLGIGLTLLGLTLALPAGAAAGGTERYIVVLKDSVSRPASVAAKHGKRYVAKVKHIYRNTIKGYSAKVSPAELAALRSDPDVAWVARDGKVSIERGGAKGKKPKPGGGSTSYSFPSWGIDRIDQRQLPLSSSYTSNASGTGVTAYVIDTGVRISHSEFGGRAAYGWDYIDNDAVAADCNGHGTHVAGTIGGTTYGVAKRVDIVAVRVLNCSGSGYWSGVIAGIDWVVGRANGPAVINLSLGGGANSAVDAAVQRAVNAGVSVAVAAGNSGANACNYSPARAPAALTVGATTSSDARASYSNYGSCLDLFGPGSSIRSAWSTGDSATKTISGTSMAAPHAAGVAALYLQGHPSASPAAVTTALASQATGGVLSSVGSGSPNRLLFTE
jgi:subtilisin family serine protease